MSFSFKLPSVIRLLRYVRIKKRFDYVPFSRANIYARDGYTCQYCANSLAHAGAHVRSRRAGLAGWPQGLGEHRHVLRLVQPPQGRPHARRGADAAGAARRDGPLRRRPSASRSDCATRPTAGATTCTGTSSSTTTVTASLSVRGAFRPWLTGSCLRPLTLRAWSAKRSRRRSPVTGDKSSADRARSPSRHRGRPAVAARQRALPFRCRTEELCTIGGTAGARGLRGARSHGRRGARRARRRPHRGQSAVAARARPSSWRSACRSRPACIRWTTRRSTRSGRVYVTYSGSRGQQSPVSDFPGQPPGGPREPFVTRHRQRHVDGVRARSAGSTCRAASTAPSIASSKTASYEVVASDLGLACGLAFAPDGTLFVGDRSGTIFHIDRKGPHRNAGDAAGKRRRVSSRDGTGRRGLCHGADAGDLRSRVPRVDGRDVSRPIDQTLRPAARPGLRPRRRAARRRSARRSERGLPAPRPAGKTLAIAGPRLVGLAFGADGTTRRQQ